MAQRRGPTVAVGVAPEYAFDPTTSLQLELTHARDREAQETSNEVELEFKHLFNHIARDGWGWGVVASWAREGEQRKLTLKVPYSLGLWEGAGLLHLNAGVTKPSDESRRWIGSAALQRDVGTRSVLFAELARDEDGTLAHAGVRH